MKEIELTWNLAIQKNRIVKFLDPKWILTFKHPLWSQDEGWRKIKRMASVGEIQIPKQLTEEFESFKKEFDYVQITIKGIKKVPTSIVPEKVDL